MQITFVRHAESVSNVAGRWQGQGDAPLSQDGRQQASALARRLQHRRFDLVISSDLQRAADTARALGQPVETDRSWREVDVGAWEGLTREQVAERFADQVEALRRGENIRIGGGESWIDLHARVDGALSRLRARLAPDARALVVTHGGVIHGVVTGLLGLRDEQYRPIARVANTSITGMRFDGDRSELCVFNDASHLGSLNVWTRQRMLDGDAVVSLIGHHEPAGESAARAAPDIERLAGWYDGLAHLYTVAGRRRQQAARALAARCGLTASDCEDLDGSLERAVQLVVERHPGRCIGVLADCTSIARYASGVVASHAPAPFDAPRHTGVSHVVVGARGPVLADYNLAPHLQP